MSWIECGARYLIDNNLESGISGVLLRSVRSSIMRLFTGKFASRSPYHRLCVFVAVCVYMHVCV